MMINLIAQSAVWSALGVLIGTTGHNASYLIVTATAGVLTANYAPDKKPKKPKGKK
jgi:hypothetical protein